MNLNEPVGSFTEGGRPQDASTRMRTRARCTVTELATMLCSRLSGVHTSQPIRRRAQTQAPHHLLPRISPPRPGPRTGPDRRERPRGLRQRVAGGLAALVAEQLGAAEDVINHVFTHGVRATLALADGDLDTAERWARSAVEYADRTDWYLLRTNSRLGLSRVLAARSAKDQARAEAQTALDICIRKGDRPRAAKARAQLDQLQA